jgi:hypothetical protein
LAARLIWLLLATLLGGLAGCAHEATTTGGVRGATNPGGEQGVCSPLPHGLLAGVPFAVALNGRYQDADGRTRRSIHLHLSESVTDVRALVERRLSDLGFTDDASEAQGSDSEGPPVVWVRAADYGSFGYRVRPIPHTASDAPVRTLLEVDTPEPPKTDEKCRTPTTATWQTLTGEPR